ncbi:hypothetical protein UMM65_15905 [Aureibaculum sp. 2210JD6-5]|uniref:hypothetical protein n=1 Tax=Aureibaculum sp. 2210JD6-5 TaxID=3103957 RepID=UPI002AAC8AD7|nr:hypothetical protein [Aureibaculum sp. 2210JD6-5]MDY7396733.1 hypothetical protein [Aureibaculum sp. 2210JD6-5]
MRKIIGILGVVAIVITMLLNVSLQSSSVNGFNSTVDLASIISTASAQTESCSQPANDPPIVGYDDYVAGWCYDSYGNDCGTTTWCSAAPSGLCYGWQCEVFI